jgi:hypothetical protein
MHTTYEPRWRRDDGFETSRSERHATEPQAESEDVTPESEIREERQPVEEICRQHA